LAKDVLGLTMSFPIYFKKKKKTMTCFQAEERI